MSGEVTVTAERQLRHRPARVFRAFVEPAEFAQWRGSPGWHVELESVRSEPQVGGRHHHVKVRDDDPVARVTTDAEFVEFAPPVLIVARQRISGDLAIDPRTPLTLRVEFGESDGGTLVRVAQGPFAAGMSDYYAHGWALELVRLDEYLREYPGS